MTKVDKRLKELGFSPVGDDCHDEALNVFRNLPNTPPKDYAKFLGSYCGGDFDSEVLVRCQTHPPQSEKGRCLFGEFFHVGAGESSLETAWKRSEELITEGLVPIASAAGGDLYCLRWRGENVDVVFWDHDSGDSYEVASSFEDFVERLELAATDPSTDLGSIKLRLDPDLL